MAEHNRTKDQIHQLDSGRAPPSSRRLSSGRGTAQCRSGFCPYPNAKHVRRALFSSPGTPANLDPGIVAKRGSRPSLQSSKPPRIRMRPLRAWDGCRRRPTVVEAAGFRCGASVCEKPSRSRRRKARACERRSAQAPRYDVGNRPLVPPALRVTFRTQRVPRRSVSDYLPQLFFRFHAHGAGQTGMSSATVRSSPGGWP